MDITYQYKEPSVIIKGKEKSNIFLSQISSHGVGQLSPLAINTTKEGRTLNRRVEVVLK